MEQEIRIKMRDIARKIGELKFDAYHTIIQMHENHKNAGKKYDEECPACVYFFYQLWYSPYPNDKQRAKEFFYEADEKHNYEYTYIYDMIAAAKLAADHRHMWTREQYDRIRIFEDEPEAVFHALFLAEKHRPAHGREFRVPRGIYKSQLVRRLGFTLITDGSEPESD